MYSTCLFCQKPLGANEVVEHFPVGRRLAFDAERGRLWVVCKRCARWNLTPIEERWEAIEECERLFRDTKLRASTEHIGLARVSEGLELVRIGRPQRPEFAAWRYGETFGRRRREMLLKVGLGLGALGAVVVGGVAAGVGVGGFVWGVNRVGNLIVKGSPRKVVARLPVGGEVVKVRRGSLGEVKLLRDRAGAWSLVVPASRGIERYGRDLELLRGYTVRLEGDDALRAAGLLLPHVNRFGGTKEKVQSAVKLLEEETDPSRLFSRFASFRGHELSSLSDTVTLALEMSAHEEAERRAMEGELAALEEMWREAEEIAAIADNMFLPPSIDEWMRKLRGG